MKAKPTTVPIIPSIKGTWEVSQDGAGCMEDSQTSEWLCLYPSSAASVCPPQLGCPLSQSYKCWGHSSAVEVGFMVIAFHVGGSTGGTFDVARASPGST